MAEGITSEASAPEGAIQVEAIQLRTYLQQVRDNQNLPLAIIGGLAASVLGAVIWAMITIWTSYQIGWMAIGVGFLVGYAVRIMGKGIDKMFGIVGATLALLGCLGGNLLMICILVSRQEGMALLDVLSRLSLPSVVQLMRLTFQPMDLLFYGIALYTGYKVSFLPVNPEDVAKIGHS